MLLYVCVSDDKTVCVCVIVVVDSPGCLQAQQLTLSEETACVFVVVDSPGCLLAQQLTLSEETACVYKRIDPMTGNDSLWWTALVACRQNN